MLAGNLIAAPAPSRDAANVYHAAEHFDISPFDLYRHAYRAWFGVEAETRNLEHRFVACLFHGEVPFWVRDYCRRAMAEAPPAPLEQVPQAAIAQPQHGAAAPLVAGIMALWLLLPGGDCRNDARQSAVVNADLAAVTGEISPGC
jgi:hypothetical protein